MKEYKVGDIVYVPCRVVGTGIMNYSKKPVVDVVPCHHYENYMNNLYKEFKYKNVFVTSFYASEVKEYCEKVQEPIW